MSFLMLKPRHEVGYFTCCLMPIEIENDPSHVVSIQTVASSVQSLTSGLENIRNEVDILRKRKNNASDSFISVMEVRMKSSNHSECSLLKVLSSHLFPVLLRQCLLFKRCAIQSRPIYGLFGNIMERRVTLQMLLNPKISSGWSWHSRQLFKYARLYPHWDPLLLTIVHISQKASLEVHDSDVKATRPDPPISQITNAPNLVIELVWYCIPIP